MTDELDASDDWHRQLIDRAPPEGLRPMQEALSEDAQTLIVWMEGIRQARRDEGLSWWGMTFYDMVRVGPFHDYWRTKRALVESVESTWILPVAASIGVLYYPVE